MYPGCPGPGCENGGVLDLTSSEGNDVDEDGKVASAIDVRCW